MKSSTQQPIPSDQKCRCNTGKHRGHKCRGKHLGDPSGMCAYCRKGHKNQTHHHEEGSKKKNKWKLIFW